MEDLNERVRGYAEQALRELVEEGPTQPEVQVLAVECRGGEGGSGRTTCAVIFYRWPAPVRTRVEFVLREGDGEEVRRANVDEIKRAFNEKVYGT